MQGMGRLMCDDWREAAGVEHTKAWQRERARFPTSLKVTFPMTSACSTVEHLDVPLMGTLMLLVHAHNHEADIITSITRLQ